MNSLYFDHNSTTPLDPSVADAMSAALRAGYANPSSQHEPGRRARRAIEEAREGIAEILGAKTTGMDADQLLFTSGGTEANNLAIFGLGQGKGRGLRDEGRVIISSIEHPSIVGPADELARRGWQVERAAVTYDGVVDVAQLALLLEAPKSSPLSPSLVSIMLANNETGVVQPIEEIARLCSAANVLLHTDAVQAVGKLPVNFRELKVAAMTVAAHKFHGPRGIGALVVKHGVPLEPLLHGGFQQAGLRPGTEDVALAVGMHVALRHWQAEAHERANRLRELRDLLEARLLAGDEQIVINGASAVRLPQTSNLAFRGLDRQALLMALDMAGVACSTGSACASGSSEPSPVLLAMGCEKGVVEGSLRLSLGAFTTAAEVDEGARRILRVVKDLRQRKSQAKSPLAPRGSAAKSL